MSGVPPGDLCAITVIRKDTWLENVEPREADIRTIDNLPALVIVSTETPTNLEIFAQAHQSTRVITPRDQMAGILRPENLQHEVTGRPVPVSCICYGEQ